MTEKKIYEMAHHWAVHVWRKADGDFQKNPGCKLLKKYEQKAWENVLELEKIAKEKGFYLS